MRRREYKGRRGIHKYFLLLYVLAFLLTIRMLRVELRVDDQFPGLFNDAAKVSLLCSKRTRASNITGTNVASSQQQGQRRIFITFSTSCNPQQDWQSQALLYTHRLHKVDTELVRLMACGEPSYELPKNDYDRYRVIRTPDYDAMMSCDPYSPRNRPLSMTYWLTVQMDDADLPKDDDVIIQMDSDQVFLNDRVDVSSVRFGKALAARYALGKVWVKDWGLPFCGDRCSNMDTENIDTSYGNPFILTARDTRRHAAVWAYVIEDMRNQMRPKDGVSINLWMTEMFAAIIAAMRLGIDFREKDMMVSNPSYLDGNDEPWHMLGWESPIAASSYPGMLVAHYCQPYMLENISWYKSDSGHVDLRQCDQRATIPDFVERLNSTTAKERRTMALVVNDGNGFTKQQVEMARTQWMFEKAVPLIRDSMVDYYRSHCENGAKTLVAVETASSIAGASAGASAAMTRTIGAARIDERGDGTSSTPLRGPDASTSNASAATNSSTSSATNMQPVDDDVHKVAGLSCAKHGGPSDELAAEMVYWTDIPEDASYVSPFREYGPAKKYLTFEPDEGGFNNIRMAMETAVAMAHAMGRTLVMPPEQRMYLLGKKDKHSKNTLSFQDFYHFDSVAVEHAGVEVISTEEFLKREIMSGNIRHPATGEIIHPPRNKTDWHGIGTYHSQDFKELAGFLREVGISSTWDYSKCIVAFPQKTGPGTSNHLEGMLQDILNDGNDASRKRSYDKNPTPVDASPRDRMREMLAHRHQLCVYNDTLQQAPVFHFPGGGKYRLLIHFYAFMFFEDYKQDLWTKRFIRDHLRYVDEIQCAAARVVAAMRERARQHGNPEGLFDTFHIRRGDLQFKESFIEADQIIDNVGDLLEEGGTIFIATDEKNMTYFNPLREHYHLYFLNDFMDELGTINKNFYGMLDQRVASRGRNFFGTYYSTFTGFITRMRGYHAQLESEVYVRTGDTQSYYFVPKQFKDAVHHYKGLHGPFWAREFPVSWRDIDRPMR